MGEVEVGSERLGNGLVAGKLLAVVRGDGMEMGGQRPQQSQDGIFDASGLAVRHLGIESQAWLALGQGDDSLFVALADDGAGRRNEADLRLVKFGFPIKATGPNNTARPDNGAPC